MHNQFRSVTLALAFATWALPASSSEAIQVHWPMMEFFTYTPAVAGTPSGPNTESGAMGSGVEVPQLLVFSSSGALAWRGHPEQLKADDLPALGETTGENEFERLLATLDRAWNNIPDFRPIDQPPSHLVKPNRPSLVLVVPVLEGGACSACDTYVKSLETIAPDWNHVTAALGQSTGS
jgi:hypothetical protein